jgi:hypothetical protein
VNIVRHVIRWRGAVVQGDERPQRREALIQGNGRKGWVIVSAVTTQEASERLLALIEATLQEWGVLLD